MNLYPRITTIDGALVAAAVSTCAAYAVGMLLAHGYLPAIVALAAITGWQITRRRDPDACSDPLAMSRA